MRDILKGINFKSKTVLLFIGLFVIVLISSIVLVSHSYYIKTDSNYIVGGTAYISDSDILLKIYLEDRDSEGTGLGTYTRVYFIPQVNYTYIESLTTCSEGLAVESFENNEFQISASSKGYCKVYFEAIDGYIKNNTMRLFVMQESGSYKETGQLPNDDKTYVINEEKTVCTSGTTVELVDREFELTTSADGNCVVYVDIAS